MTPNNLRVLDTPYCCYPNDGCVCPDDERMLRARVAGMLTAPLTAEEREWCICKADWAGEGYYSREELAAYDDRTLCAAVIKAWGLYVQGL